MEKVNIKTLKNLKKLKIGETYEVNEWGLEPEIIEEKRQRCLSRKNKP
ncbi:Uncharacterised protein [uncultured archaeon]|nr:Uncharacterised protein [uncultured archaeon]